jgi:phospholipid/cholesterol/gamma-HCH transport system permease protein
MSQTSHASLSASQSGDSLEVVLHGTWTADRSRHLEQAADGLIASHGGKSAPRTIVLVMDELLRLDTLGALVIERLRLGLERKGSTLHLKGATEAQRLLIEGVRERTPDWKKPKPAGGVLDFVTDIGRGVADVGKDVREGVGFLGAFIASLGRVIIAPWRFRWAALTRQLEIVAFRSVPLIVLISFLVGAIIAQQSVFQLRSFGTTAFVADLLGILVLRELGVLLTSIMMAGRSGSAITAELGSMKMREEIDALRTMGVDPMEVLVVPRVLALIISLPLLTFIGSMAALFGGGLVAWIYGDVSPDVFLGRLQNAIKLNTFMVGMIKAPFMALVIGLIATIEGLAVKGSAESLGQQTTASVVKAIFMVIVVDGLFAMFFAAIRY